MKRIEQLLSQHPNKEHYDYLLRDIKRRKLVIFFGAGLSLWKKYKRWGYPFEWAQALIEERYRQLLEYYSSYATDTDTQDKMKKVAAIINKGKASNDYLLWGDCLDEAIAELHNIYKNTPLKKYFPYKSFKDMCVEAFIAEGTPPEFETPYHIPSVFFLLYLSNLLITTNVEKTFDEVCQKVGREDWNQIAITPRDENILRKWNTPNKAIYYIHGHINEPDTLIMTLKEYDAMYPRMVPAYSGRLGTRDLLGKIASDYSVMFLGASLQIDRTVDVINYDSSSKDVSACRRNEQLHFFPITALLPNGNLASPPMLDDYSPLTFSNNNFCEISSLLLQSVRETQCDWKYCTWQPMQLPKGKHDLPENVISTIAKSLDSNLTFEIIPIVEPIDPSVVVHYLHEHHSIHKHDSGLGWSICSVKDSHFSLDGYKKEENEPFSPLHNYPLGDTIYVLLGDISLPYEEEEGIADIIEKWHRQYAPIRDSDPEEDGRIVPRVRIIMVLPERYLVDYQDLEERSDQVITYLESIGQTLSPETKQAVRRFIIGRNAPFFRLLQQKSQQEGEANKKDETDENTQTRAKEIFPVHVLRLTP